MKTFLHALLALATLSSSAADLPEVLVYPLREDGSIMHWLQVAPLPWNAAYIGDSQSYDPFKRAGQSELTLRPRAGDKVYGLTWRKQHSNGTTEGPSMCSLFQHTAGGFSHAYSAVVIYLYSPAARPDATFAGSADDGLKVVLNGRKLWSNQIQRSPTYDSDRFKAPLGKGWNTLTLLVDQITGGHLFCARFLDGGQAVTDLQIALDPPAAEAKRHPAAAYNAAAAAALAPADNLRAEGKLAEAAAAYEACLASHPLAETAPRAAHAAALCLADLPGQAQKATVLLEKLIAENSHDVLAEYALLDLGRMHQEKLKDRAAAAASYERFETVFPESPRGATALVALARIQAAGNRHEEAIRTCRKAIAKYPQTDEVMTATLAIADFYKASGDAAKAIAQYEVARVMAQDWHDNKYGVDVGKQAWLRELLEYIRKQAP